MCTCSTQDFLFYEKNDKMACSATILWIEPLLTICRFVACVSLISAEGKIYQRWWVSNTNKGHPYNPTVSTNSLLLLFDVLFWLCWRCCRYICFLTACFSRTVSTSFLCLRLDLSGLLNIRKRKARNLTLIILQSVRSPPHLVVTSPWGDDGPLVECLSDFELCCRRTLTLWLSVSVVSGLVPLGVR